jgi:hypothetical protein
VNRWDLRKVGRLRSWQALAKNVFLIRPGLLIDRAEAVGIGGRYPRLWSALRSFARGVGRQWLNAITRRGQFPGRYFLVDPL